MKMGAAPVPQNVKRNTRKRRRKRSIRKRRKKRKRRKNESISLPSQMRVQTQSDKSLTCSTFSSQKSNTVAKEQRNVESERNRRERHQERRRFGVTGVNSHLPSSKDVTPRRVSCILPGASSGQRLISGWKAFLIVLLPADHCGS